jgi:hypothetical protein
MKMKFGFFVAMVSTSLLADQPALTPATTNTPPPTLAPAPAAMSEPVPSPAPVAEKPAKKTPRKKAAKKPMQELRTTPLVAGPATVAANHVNVRGRAGLIGEVVTRMTNGESVTVIEEISLKHSQPDEPSAWAKILLPSTVPVWVKSSYIDAGTKTVSVKKLNLRGGPGENYSVLGTLVKGDAVTEIETKGDWTKIQAPTNAFAFMAAQYLKQDATPATPVAPTEPALTPAPVVETPVVAPAPTETPMTPAPMEPATNDVAVAPTPAPEPVVEEPLPPRIVQREGLVRGTFSIQAPTPYELINTDNKRAINYLYTTSTNLDLSRYKGLHIIVTGEEGLDERWKNTPVITIQRIQVLE